MCGDALQRNTVLEGGRTDSAGPHSTVIRYGDGHGFQRTASFERRFSDETYRKRQGNGLQGGTVLELAGGNNSYAFFNDQGFDRFSLEHVGGDGSDIVINFIDRNL